MDQGLVNLPAEARAADSGFDPIVECVLQRVRLRARRRTAWLRKLWSEEGEPGDQNTVTHAEIDTHLEDRDAPAAEAAWYASDQAIAPLNRELVQLESALLADEDSRFAQLHQLFDIGPQDSDLLQTCLALAVDPSLRRVYAYLQDHAGRPHVTEEFAARLFGQGRGGIWPPDSPLFRWELLTQREIAPSEPPLVACDPLIRDWLLDQNRLDESLIDIASFKEPYDPLSGWPVEQTADLLTRRLQGEYSGTVRVSIVGNPGSGRRTLAATICAHLGFPLLTIDSDQIAERDWQKLFLRAQRQAYLERYALAWHGDNAMRRAWPPVVPWFPVQFLICDADQRPEAVPGVIDHRIQMPIPALDERRKLWRQLLPVSAAWPRDAFNALVTGHQVTVGEIKAAAQSGIDRVDDATEFVREARRHRLGKLAQLVECPFNWDDLVVSDALREALEDLIFEATERVVFWERPEARRLFPQGRGLIGLFAGSPGTGKTMAAQVIAGELGLDLFRIDLSTVVSKYVGETSQNLERIVSRAAQMDAVLLFDEADALFGKRTEIRDAHDRFANTDTGYLLQAIENYPGVALLATNQKANIDPAFIRRLRYVLEFPKPDEGQRLKIWRRIVEELAGAERLEELADGLKRLAEAMEITGAQIKFSILAAVFAAKRDGESLGMTHLLRGLERELMKEGRAFSDRQRERLLGHG
jgi:hypothetical protein